MAIRAMGDCRVGAQCGEPGLVVGRAPREKPGRTHPRRERPLRRRTGLGEGNCLARKPFQPSRAWSRRRDWVNATPEEAAQEWADAEQLADFVHEHCFHPLTNTFAGAFYLRKLLKRYTRTDNPIPYALADYNAGRGNVVKWLQGEAATNSAIFVEGIPFPGTKKYVKSILHRYQRYRS